MTVAFRKVGEAVATKVVQRAKSTATKAAAATTKAATPGQAVSKEEAPYTIPAKESTTTTMMPWKGWVDRFLKDRLSDDQYKAWQDTFYFMADDINKMEQMPPAAHRVPVAQDGQEAGFREVSPGSQGPVDVPLHSLDDDPYDSGYFKRDTRRMDVDPEFPNPEVEKLKLELQDPNDPEVQEAKAKLEGGPKSSPGNGLRFATGPSNFDPTGLRAVMAVTHAEMKKSMAKHLPDHLPEPVWKDSEEELVQWYKDRDLPVPMGGNWNYVSKHRRVARW